MNRRKSTPVTSGYESWRPADVSSGQNSNGSLCLALDDERFRAKGGQKKNVKSQRSSRTQLPLCTSQTLPGSLSRSSSVESIASNASNCSTGGRGYRGRRGRGKSQDWYNGPKSQTSSNASTGRGQQMSQHGVRRHCSKERPVDNENNSDSRGRGRGRGASSSSDTACNRRVPVLNFNQLDQLLSQEPSDIILSLVAPRSGLQERLSHHRLQPEMMFQILTLLARALASNIHPENQNCLMGTLLESNLFSAHVPMLVATLVSSKDDRKVFENLVQIFRALLRRMPVAASENVSDCVKLCIQIMRLQTDATDAEKVVKTDMVEIENNIQEILDEKSRQVIEKKKAKRILEISDDEPPEDFREISITPHIEEITTNLRPFLRKNVTRGNYKNVDHYLDVHFRLLREDFVAPLRQGINDYLRQYSSAGNKKSKIRDIRVYEGVKIEGTICRRDGIYYEISFDINPLKRIKWEVSKRLINGSLLCLSADNFQSIRFATVSIRDPENLKKGKLGVKFEGDYDEKVELSKKDKSLVYIMAESQAYFEAYRHILRGLQQVNGDMPLKNYIVYVQRHLEPPQYLDYNTKYDMSCVLVKNNQTKWKPRLRMTAFIQNYLKVAGQPDYLLGVDDKDDNEDECDQGSISDLCQTSVLDARGWPTGEDLGLDDSQKRAMYLALTSSLAIIQGPPGTGKTYIGLKIVKTLLNNQSAWKNAETTEPTPILVVCLTNHALDQFLEGITSFTTRLVRVGNRSKNENLDKYNIRYIRDHVASTRNRARNVYSNVEALQHKLRIIRGKMETQQVKIQWLSAFVLHENALEILTGEDKRLVTSLRDGFASAFGVQPHGQPWCPRSFLAAWLGLTLEEFVTEDELEEFRITDEDDFHEVGARQKANPVGPEICALPAPGMAEVDALDSDDDLIDIEDEGTIELQKRLLDDDAPEIPALTIPDQETSWAVHVESLSNPYYHFPNAEKLDQLVLESCSRMGQIRREIAERELQKNEKMDEVEVTFEVVNVWNLPLCDRWRLYRRWVDLFRIAGASNVNELQEEYARTAQRLKEVINGEELAILRQCDVVGMTTTGAAKYHQVLQELGPRIVIVEEAAEVLESHIVTTLSTNTQHLILIGDHQQLRPNTAVYKLATDYHLDVSLFERMIKNEVRYETLQLQHRMRPEISRLIVPLIYPNLEDHPSVRGYSSIKGICKSMFFVNHSCNEEAVADSMTHANQFEAEYLAGLCFYLIQQGYKREQITILTTYSGQLFALRRLMKKDLYEGVRIMVVDNYQGEENDIILLSFVRSNEEGKIGFLKIENRVNVALSRARKGLYCVGNFTFFASKSDLWRRLVANLERDESIGSSIELKCQKHPDSLTNAAKGEDFGRLAPEGGCLKLCNEIQECGHECKRICHLDHHLRCTEQCRKILCNLNHQCPLLCYQDCQLCKVPVRKAFQSCEHSALLPCYKEISEVKCKTKVERSLTKCGHKTKLECHVDPETHKCRQMVDLVLPHCQHQRKVECHVDPETVSCLEECDYRLDCGHVCPKTCHPSEDPGLEHILVECHKPCQKKICELDHTCKMRCYQPCNKCVILVEKELPCGHRDQVPCSQDVNSVICSKNCKRIMACGHPCKLKCKDSCGQCAAIVDKAIPECGHMVKIKCMDDPSVEVCRKRCTRLLSCGHVCPNKCCVPCISQCKHPVPASGMCGHSSTVPCHAQKNSEVMLTLYCQNPCGRMLPCEHQCKGTCGECRQGRVHVPCREICGRVQICGHACDAPCSKACIPCKRKCPTRCPHSRCPKKCGQPCKKCKESCKWRCSHLKCNKSCGEFCERPRCDESCTRELRCGHLCIGLCGELCPKLCRECDSEKLTEFILFGFEEEVNARFIQLEDCGHCIEIRAMDHWMSMGENEIQMKCCPRCKTTIWRSRRYGNVIRSRMLDVQKVKKQLFGSNKTLRGTVNRLQHKLATKYNLQMNCPSEIQKLQKRLCSQFVLHQNELVVIENQINILDLMFKVKEKISQMKVEAKDYFNADMNLLTQRLMQNEERITEYELGQINHEVHRVFLQAAVIDTERVLETMYYAQEGLNDAMMQHLNDAKALLSHGCTLTEQEEKAIQVSVEKAVRFVGGLGITDRERVEIVKAMQLTSGHWYKCPKGHVYAIGECGRANQVGTCPECKARIGGSGYRLTVGNVAATEMYR